MMSTTWRTWLQRTLITFILMLTTVGLGYFGLVAVVPVVESFLVGAPTTMSLSIPPPAGATPAPIRPGAGGPGAPGSGPTATSATSMREVQKLVLAASSIDGPALWVRSPSTSATAPGTTAGNGSSAGKGSAIGGVLAWTDTGRYHRLHLLLSPDGLHYDRELLLPANAIARPSVVVAPAPTATQANVVILAWTGIDPAHSLNLMYDALGAQQVLTLPQGSSYAPALALFAGQLWLAWTGTEPSHPLHIRALALTAHGLVPGADTLLGAYSSQAVPALAPDDQQHQLLLSWTAAAASTPWMRLAASPDGLHWQLVPTAGPVQASSTGSTLLALPATPAVSPPLTNYYWAWPGTDRWHALKLTLAPTITEWASPVTIPLEWCVGAPGMGFLGTTGHAQQILLAWTGIDPEHHLTLALFQLDSVG
jgi:hypothetical protein